MGKTSLITAATIFVGAGSTFSFGVTGTMKDQISL